jgi:hypothetical protein
VIEPSGTITNIAYDTAKGFLTSVSRVGAGLTQTTTITYSPVTINGQSTLIGLPTPCAKLLIS